MLFRSVRGTTILVTVALLIVSGIRASTGTTIWVFDLRFLCLRLSSNLYYCYFTLCSFFSFSTSCFKAGKQAIQKTGLPSETFPEKCPLTPEDILNSDDFQD